MNSGLESARTITEWYLARIEEIDKQGPAINAILELDPEALGGGNPLGAIAGREDIMAHFDSARVEPHEQLLQLGELIRAGPIDRSSRSNTI